MGDLRVLSKDEIAKHHSESDLWVIINNKVYDVTKYAPDHPGGPELLQSVAGADGSEGFNDIGHSQDAHKQMEEFLVGKLEGAEQSTTTESSDAAKASSSASRPTVSPPNDMTRWLTVLAIVAALMIVLALVPIDPIALELLRLEGQSQTTILR